MQRLALLMVLPATTALADPEGESKARAKIRDGKIAIGVGAVLAAAGGGLVYYYGNYCDRFADSDAADGCVVKEVAVGALIGAPLLAGGLIATGYGIGRWWVGRRELDAAVKITAIPMPRGGGVAVTGTF